MPTHEKWEKGSTVVARQILTIGLTILISIPLGIVAAVKSSAGWLAAALVPTAALLLWGATRSRAQFKCPKCTQPMAPVPATKDDLELRFACQRCDIIWHTGATTHSHG